MKNFEQKFYDFSKNAFQSEIILIVLVVMVKNLSIQLVDII